MINVYVKSRPVKYKLNFGINAPVIFSGLNTADRLTRDGSKSKMTGFIKFSKVDDENEIIAASEFSFFKLDATDLERTEKNFDSQFTKYMDIADVLYHDDDLDAAITSATIEVFGKDGGDIDDAADALFAFNSKTLKKKAKKSKKDLTKMAIDLQNNLVAMFDKVLNKKAGIENSPKFHLLVVIDAKGYKKLPYDGHFISLEDDLAIDPYYNNIKEEYDKPKTPDDIEGDLDDMNNIDGDTDSLDEAAGDLNDLVENDETSEEEESTVEDSDEPSFEGDEGPVEIDDFAGFEENA